MRKRTWQKAEKLVAEQQGGRVQPGSGSRWFAKQDVKCAEKLIQVKTTDKKQYILKLEDLEILEQHALKEDCEPVFIVIFRTPEGIKQYKIERQYNG